MKPYAFGVDLGGTTVKLGLFGPRGLMDQWEIPTRADHHGAALLPDIAAAIRAKCAQSGISPHEIEGVGLGVPGAVLGDRYVKPCVNLDGWGGFDVADALQALCGLPVRIVNDANAAALGEMSRGGGQGARNVVFVTLGTGVGGGVIVDGRLLAGVHGAGGEIGHIKVRPGGSRVCGCGKTGCLEQYASATGLVRSARDLLADPAVQTALRDCGELSCKAIFDCAKTGDAAALGLVDEMADLLGQALAAVSCVCDPEVVVVGGGVARAGQMLLDRIAAAFRRYAFPAAEETRFALAALGNDAGIWGAVQLVRGA